MAPAILPDNFPRQIKWPCPECQRLFLLFLPILGRDGQELGRQMGRLMVILDENDGLVTALLRVVPLHVTG
jgi:hypothetical protein